MRAWRMEPLYPRMAMPTLRPLAASWFANHRVSGVLPVPPTEMLPITITGTPGCPEENTPREYSNRRTATSNWNIHDRGRSNHGALAEYQRRCSHSPEVESGIELQPVKLRVQPILRQQLGMVSGLDDAPGVDHDDQICLLHR